MITTFTLTERPLPGARQPENWTGMKTQLEHWRPAPIEKKDLYEVSDKGRVRNARTKYILKPHKNRQTKYQYLQVNLSNHNKYKAYLVHRLVGMAFPDLVGWTEKAKGKPFEVLEINHKDRNTLNNNVNNLEWCDRRYNSSYDGADERRTETKRNNGDYYRPVMSYTRSGEPMEYYTTSAEAAESLGIDRRNIRLVCNGYRSSAAGLQWRWADTVDTTQPIGKYVRNSGLPRKPVRQMTKDREVVAEFPSTMEAARQTGYNHEHISECCNGKLKTYQGFLWEYVQ